MPDIPQVAVSPNNPCPFLRALVANGHVGGHLVPLSRLCGVIEAASGKQGLEKTRAGIATYLIALIANGFGHVPASASSGAVLDGLRDGPLDKRGAGSRILGVDAQVHLDEIERLATFGMERKDPSGSSEIGLTAQEIEIFMAANLKRAGDQARWYYPFMMKGEWPVLLDILGKGDGDARYLSVAEVRTLFVDRRLPDRIAARLPG
jgi:hypothetical protein